MSEKDVKVKKKVEISVPDSSIALSTWISLKLAQDKNLRSVQRKELEVFMKCMGLNEVENAEQYENAYKKF